MTDEKRLHIKNLTVKIMTEKGVGEAVRGLNLDLRPGEIRGIVGESGCGKSVTAKSILKLHDNEHTELSTRERIYWIYRKMRCEVSEAMILLIYFNTPCQHLIISIL